MFDLAHNYLQLNLPTQSVIFEVKMSFKESEFFADKIVQAIRKFGWSNQDRAKLFLGDLSWKIVLSEGGWIVLCQSIKSEYALTQAKKRWSEKLRSDIAIAC